MGEGGLDGFSFWLEASWSETTTCNTPIFWAWAIGNQWNALPLPLQSCDSWMFVKENPDKKKGGSVSDECKNEE